MKRKKAVYVVGAFAVLMVALGYAAYRFRVTQIRKNCEDNTHFVYSKRSDIYISVVDTTCDFLGGSEQVKINLVSKGVFQRVDQIFVYDPDSMDKPPLIRWSDVDTLEITATGVTHIITKKNSVNGIKVIYNISGV